MADKAQKYLFNHRDFSDQAIQAEAKAQKNAPPPPPTFTESQLANAKKQAFQEGFNQAVQEQKTAREAQLSHVFDEIKRQIDILITSETVRSARFEKESVQIALAMMSHMYPTLHAYCAEDQLMADLSQALEKNRDQDAIVLKVHPEMMDLVQNRFSSMDVITIQSDPKLGMSDATLSWPNGGVEINRDAMMKDLESLMGDVLQGKETPEVQKPELMADAQDLHYEQETVGDDGGAITNSDGKDSPEGARGDESDLDVD